MHCEAIVDLATSLPMRDVSAELETHLRQCVACAETIALLRAAALPPVSAEETSSLRTATEKTLEEILPPRRSNAGHQRFGGYALAASLGAVVASGLWAKNSLRPPASSSLSQVTCSAAASVDLFDPTGLYEVPWLPRTDSDDL